MGEMGGREEKKIQEKEKIPFLLVFSVPISFLLVLLIRRGKEKEKKEQAQKTWTSVSL